MRRRGQARPAAWLLGATAVLGLSGCQLGYYLHLARGQARVVYRCQPLEEVLARPDLPDTTARRLALVGEIRRYARLQIGLSTSRSYTCFHDPGDRPVSWNVSACPPDRLEAHEWSFPVVGRVPYKGFFDLDLARRERDLMGARGFDTLLRPVIAYSALGYLSDPVLPEMLRLPEEALAELLIHELTHATVFRRGQTDFNESLATFVGTTGSLSFLADRYGPGSQVVDEARRRRQDAARFAGFMATVLSSLDSLYRSGAGREAVLAERGPLFESTKERYRQLRPALADPGRFDGFLDWDVNNARLLSYRRYHRDLGLFEALWETRGRSLKAVVAAVRECGGGDDPWACVRRQAAAGGQP